ncbi:hypothetical protein EIN_096310 [Entamoeba invadens IP1]|uniref:RRM domain-containing protein n=1 Tax=Entamoeba invadens IP1 TaxID=370355 RepID=A0A0A1U0H0_ENTIV|nr:hypothetical protein EIN_096310 [Entamoeba invadens IP1]ELP87374.1 hypothetical protein EIN_096310 [Entamoeba invadens IP1]|eukprot:XP_004254145.1 hypothetical protein EIN_096310 [Entamoeba invadens IP1]
MNETVNRQSWAEKNRLVPPGWTATVLNKKERSDIFGFEDTKQGTTFGEKTKSVLKNLDVLLATLDSRVKTVTIPKFTFQPVVDHYRDILVSSSKQKVETQKVLITQKAQENVKAFQEHIENEITKYEEAVRPLIELKNLTDTTQTENAFDEFNKSYTLFKPITDSYITKYTEEYPNLLDSQKVLSEALDEWEKEISIRGHLIQAVHINSQRRITGIFEGHEDKLEHLKFDVGLLLRLVLCLTSALSYDGDRRLRVSEKFLEKILRDKEEIDSVALQVFHNVKPKIMHNLQTEKILKTENSLILMGDIEKTINKMVIKETPKHIDGFWVEVNNIPPNANTDFVITLFKKIGQVNNTIKIVDGRCQVQYMKLDEALSACKLDNRTIKNSTNVLSVRLLQ